MPQFFLNKRLIILLVSIIILVALIGFSLRDRKQLTWPEQFVKDTTGWVQTLVSRPAHYIAGVFRNMDDLQNTYKENKKLKAKLDELAQLEYQVQSLKKDNDELRKILDIQDSLSDFEITQATVIGRNPDRWQRNELLIINQGTTHGVEKDMAVISSNGSLIGKVKNSQPYTSTVQLLSSMDPTNRISASIDGSSVMGLIQGYDKDKGLLLLKDIPNGETVNKDQLVGTSGLGGVFPEDIFIGTIVDVEPDDNGLTQTAYVKPGANFYDLEHLMVVKRVMTQPNKKDMAEGEEKNL
ncbi:rod shape-determining protein MreC [Bacillus sp. 03113]|uniref:rod shape-determining protein MreC n=1 Tax=Bacillus sp. 03113 TaxID=2578211 RepID=UPI0011443B26|nr:rod shape-determining protein MreC [Bacillus sp. 03113]